MNCPEEQRDSNHLGGYALPEAFLFVGFLSNILQSDLFQNDHVLYNAQFADLLYNSPISIELVLQNPRRNKVSSDEEFVTKIVSGDKSKLPWDDVGLALLFSFFYDFKWPFVYSYEFEWDLIFPHCMILIEDKSAPSNTIYSMFSKLLDRVPSGNVYVKDVHVALDIIKYLIDLLCKSHLIYEQDKGKTVNSLLPMPGKMHHMIRKFWNDRCDRSIQVQVIDDSIQFFKEKKQLEIMPLLIDMLRYLKDRLSLDDFDNILKPFLVDMRTAATDTVTNEELLQMHEIYLSVSSLFFLFLRGTKSTINSTFVCESLETIKMLSCIIQKRLDCPSAKVEGNEMFRLYLVQNAFSQLLRSA